MAESQQTLVHPNDGNLVYVPPPSKPPTSGGSGMYIAMYALMNAIVGIQSIGVSYLHASATIQQEETQQANYYLNIISGTGSSGWNGQIPSPPPVIKGTNYPIFSQNGLPLYVLDPTTGQPVIDPKTGLPEPIQYTNHDYPNPATYPVPADALPDATYVPAQTFSFEQQINWITANGGQMSSAQQSEELEAATTSESVANTEYQQVTSAFSGMVDGANSMASNVQQASMNDMEEYTQGPLQLINTISSIL